MGTHKANHKKLWSYLIDNPDKKLVDWPEWEANGGSISAQADCIPYDYFKDCFKCYLNINSKSITKLKKDINGIGCMNGLLESWMFEKDIGKKINIAMTIRGIWYEPK